MIDTSKLSGKTLGIIVAVETTIVLSAATFIFGILPNLVTKDYLDQTVPKATKEYVDNNAPWIKERGKWVHIIEKNTQVNEQLVDAVQKLRIEIVKISK